MPFAIAGAVYATLFLLPFIYLLQRMNGTSIHRTLLRGAYVALFGYVWMLGALVQNVVLLQTESQLRSIIMILLVCNVLTWIMSLGMVRNREYPIRGGKEIPAAKLSGGVEDPRDWRNSLPHFSYILPFVLALVWVIGANAVRSF